MHVADHFWLCSGGGLEVEVGDAGRELGLLPSLVGNTAVSCGSCPASVSFAMSGETHKPKDQCCLWQLFHAGVGAVTLSAGGGETF